MKKILLFLFVLAFSTALMSQERSEYSKTDEITLFIPHSERITFVNEMMNFLGLSDDSTGWQHSSNMRYFSNIGEVRPLKKTLIRNGEKEERFDFYLGRGDYLSALTIVVSYNGERLFEQFPSPEDSNYSTIASKKESLKCKILSNEWQEDISLIIKFLGLNEFPKGEYPTEKCVATSWTKTGSYGDNSEIWEKTIKKRDDNTEKEYVFEVHKSPHSETSTLNITTSYMYVKNEPTSALIGQINGHDYVDLGLSVVWATCNIGASTPSDPGDCYAWGEIRTKSEYTIDNWFMSENNNIDNISGNRQFDAARANWGGTWRLPTKEEMDELIEKCNVKWIMHGGLSGYEVTGPNGNSIFLPAAGVWGAFRNAIGKQGMYWSDNSACALLFSDGEFFVTSSWPLSYGGMTVRPVSRHTEATLDASQNITKQPVASTSLKPTYGEINGHEYVDLGLSVKWATCNIGADSPSDYGNYYAWGETMTKTEYTDINSVTYNKTMGDIAGNAQYDAARANWGGTWRLPTTAEINELISKCKQEWTIQGDHAGYLFTGPNGNSIFLPAAGGRYETPFNDEGVSGDYHSGSTPNGESTSYADHLYFGKGEIYVDWSYRDLGRSVRPVSE